MRDSTEAAPGKPDPLVLSKESKATFAKFVIDEGLEDHYIDRFFGDQAVWDLAIRIYHMMDEPRHRYLGAFAYGSEQKRNGNSTYASFIDKEYSQYTALSYYNKKHKVFTTDKGKLHTFSKGWFQRFKNGDPFENYEQPFRAIKMHERLMVNEVWLYDHKPHPSDMPEWLLKYVYSVIACDQYVRVNMRQSIDKKVFDFETPISDWINGFIGGFIQGLSHRHFISNFATVYPMLSTFLSRKVYVPMSLFALDMAIQVLREDSLKILRGAKCKPIDDTLNDMQIDSTNMPTLNSDVKKLLTLWVLHQLTMARHKGAFRSRHRWADDGNPSAMSLEDSGWMPDQLADLTKTWSRLYEMRVKIDEIERKSK